MEGQGKKKKNRVWIWVIVVAAVILAVVVWYFSFSRSMPNPATVFSGNATDTYQGYKVSDIYSADVPSNAKPTEAASVVAATPNPSLPIKNRTYNMSASASGFNPSSITVNAFDTITLEFTAVDGAYDFSIPYLGAYFYPIQKGQTKELILTAAGTGTFTFECKDYCPSSGPIKGTLTVIPQKF